MCDGQDEFQRQCVTWEDDFRLAGIRATNFNCPNSRCYSQDWCVRGARCALQENGEWGQCIMCHEKSPLEVKTWGFWLQTPLRRLEFSNLACSFHANRDNYVKTSRLDLNHPS